MRNIAKNRKQRATAYLPISIIFLLKVAFVAVGVKLWGIGFVWALLGYYILHTASLHLGLIALSRGTHCHIGFHICYSHVSVIVKSLNHYIMAKQISLFGGEPAEKPRSVEVNQVIQMEGYDYDRYVVYEVSDNEQELAVFFGLD